LFGGAHTTKQVLGKISTGCGDVRDEHLPPSAAGPWFRLSATANSQGDTSMPSLDAVRALTTDSTAKALEAVSTNRSAEVGGKLGSTEPFNALVDRGPSSADADCTRSGSVGGATIEYWYFCDGGDVMRKR